MNDAFAAVNRVLKAGGDVYVAAARPMHGGRQDVAGRHVLHRRRRRDDADAPEGGDDLGVEHRRRRSRPGDATQAPAPERIALCDQYGGSMPSGWTRFDARAVRVSVRRRLPAGPRRGQPESEVRRAHPAVGRGAGERRARGGRGGGRWRAGRGRAFRRSTGTGSAASRRETTVPELQAVPRAGRRRSSPSGTSANLGLHARPADRRTTRRGTRTGQERALPAEKYYVPGSILQRRGRHDAIRWRSACRATSTCSSTTARCSGSAADAAAKGVTPVAWFDTARRCAAAGRGARTTSRARCEALEANDRQGQAVPVRPGDHLPRAAARDVQVPVQRDLRRRREADAVTERRREP